MKLRKQESGGEQKILPGAVRFALMCFSHIPWSKDHRTNVEIGNAQTVLDGNFDPFINAYLKWKSIKKRRLTIKCQYGRYSCADIFYVISISIW